MAGSKNPLTPTPQKTMKDNTEQLGRVLDALTAGSTDIDTSLPGGTTPPSVDQVRRMVRLVKTVVFPGYFNERFIHRNLLRFHLGATIDEMHAVLTRQILGGMHFSCCPGATLADAADMADRFVGRLPYLKDMLHGDVQAIFDNDPAVDNYPEIIFSYPVVRAMIHYRVAHELHAIGVPVLPRMITELAHSATGIDIHPGARIGRNFGIDHGTGVVIGETCIIGNHVTIYQGVTLGAKNFTYDGEGRPVNLPRHPVIEDHVTIYSNATVLGRITVGHHTVIGGNVWLTESVPPGSRIIQRKAVAETYRDGAGI